MWLGEPGLTFRGDAFVDDQEDEADHQREKNHSDYH